MFKIFDYKLWLIIGLVFLVIHLYQEISSIKSSIKKLETSKNNSINQIDNFPTNLELLPQLQTPQPIIQETINLNEIGKVNLKTKENEDYQSESDIQIYSNDASNDAFSTDISVGITDNLNELKKFIDSKAFENNISQDISSSLAQFNPEVEQSDDDNSDNDDDNLDEDEDDLSSESNLDKVINLSDNDENSENNLLDDSSENIVFNLEELKKMNKNDLTELATKFNVGIVKKLDNGRLKSKTKQELINDLNNYQSSKK